MSSTRPAPADRRLPRGHLLVLNRSFRRTLEAENKSPRTIEAYTDAVRLLATYCQAHAKPLLAADLQREHVQAFIADQLARWKPATAHNRQRPLRDRGSGRGAGAEPHWCTCAGRRRPRPGRRGARRSSQLDRRRDGTGRDGTRAGMLAFRPVRSAEALPAVESDSASPGLGYRGLLGHEPCRP
jgi:hypothetical protein